MDKINNLKISLSVLDIAHILPAEQAILGMGLRANDLDVDIHVHSKFPSTGISQADQELLDATLVKSAALVAKVQAIDVTPPVIGAK